MLHLTNDLKIVEEIGVPSMSVHVPEVEKGEEKEDFKKVDQDSLEPTYDNTDDKS